MPPPAAPTAPAAGGPPAGTSVAAPAASPKVKGEEAPVRSDGPPAAAAAAAAAAPPAPAAAPAPAPAPAPTSNKDKFRADFAAAVGALAAAQPRTIGADGEEEEAGALPADGGAGACAGGAADGALDAGSEPVRGGLGYGVARPDGAAHVEAAKAAAEARQAQARREASLQPGLNRSTAPQAGADVSGAAMGVGPQKQGPPGPPGPQGPPPKRPRVQGPSMPPPTSRAPKPAEDGPMGADDDFEWKPPQGQSGDGKSTLNARLGY